MLAEHRRPRRRDRHIPRDHLSWQEGRRTAPLQRYLRHPEHQNSGDPERGDVAEQPDWRAVPHKVGRRRLCGQASDRVHQADRDAVQHPGAGRDEHEHGPGREPGDDDHPDSGVLLYPGLVGARVEGQGEQTESHGGHGQSAPLGRAERLGEHDRRDDQHHR